MSTEALEQCLPPDESVSHAGCAAGQQHNSDLYYGHVDPLAPMSLSAAYWYQVQQLNTCPLPAARCRCCALLVPAPAPVHVPVPVPVPVPVLTAAYWYQGESNVPQNFNAKNTSSPFRYIRKPAVNYLSNRSSWC